MILVYQCMAPYIDQLFRAVAAHEPVVGVEVRLSEFGFLLGRRRLLREKPYPIIQVDLPRGYGRKFFWLARRRLAEVRPWAEEIARDKLRAVVFTIPHLAPLVQDYADVLRVYYVADNYRRYGWGDGFVTKRERQIVEHVDYVLCVSNKLRERFVEDYRVPAERCHVSPNATREENLLSRPLKKPLPLPLEAASLKRPVAGVIGRLGARTDFCLLLGAARATPWLSWLLVGPLSDCPDAKQQRAQAVFLSLPRVLHIGLQPYESLHRFARALDVAIIPYLKSSVATYGSPVRLFDHLAATRPIISTRGCAQCEEYASMLRLVDNAEELTYALYELRRQGFQDGYAARCWSESQSSTWQRRASYLVSEVFSKAPHGRAARFRLRRRK